MKSTNWKMRVSAGSAALLFASCLYAQDWPQWRGPNRDNKVTGFTVPANWPKDKLKEAWKVTVGLGDGSPVLVGDRVYVFTRVGGEEVIVCLNANDGKEVWKDKYATAAVTGGSAQAHPGPRSSPAVAEGKVCTVGVNGVVTCVDALTGKRAWQKDTKAFPMFYTGSSPLIVEGKCITNLGKNKGELTAFDLATGSERWKWTAPEAHAYGSPVLMTNAGTKQVVTVTGKAIAGVSLADGKPLWQFPIAAGKMNTTPIVDGDTVYFSGLGTGSLAIKIEKQGDAFIAKQLWKESLAASQYNSPTLKDGVIYGISTGKKFFAQDAKTGKAVDTFSGPNCGETGAVIDAGTVLVALSQDGNLVVFAPGKEYKELAKYKVADAPWGVPILSGNRIIVKGRDALTLWKLE